MLRNCVVFWFRRDLRLNDNVGLYHALKKGIPVIPLFIFDTDILHDLEDKSDKRVAFIYEQIALLKNELIQLGSDLLVLKGEPGAVLNELLNKYTITEVYCNHDYEPSAILRDKKINTLLNDKKIAFQTYKDQCIFERDEVVKDDGKPYTVFTPYSKKWKAKLKDNYPRSYPCSIFFDNFIKLAEPTPLMSLSTIGFSAEAFEFPEKTIPEDILKAYALQRNMPAVHGTSRLGVHLRFGTISIRQATQSALNLSETWLNELIWRDFYMQILSHFPHVAHSAFKPAYNHIQWINNEDEFEKWRLGNTGYPIVDAGMRELYSTGFMHNRVRMITASFLTKHLLIDWRWGEAWFAQKLLDFDLSANNGGWQWAAGSGTDAAPYFRIFNPALQTQKFDPQLQYIKKWVPEYNTAQYPLPMVNHAVARDRCLTVYKKALTALPYSVKP